MINNENAVKSPSKKATKMPHFFKAILMIIIVMAYACDEKVDPELEDERIAHPLTFTTGESGFRFEANGVLYDDVAAVGSSAENNNLYPVIFRTTNPPVTVGTINWLPMRTGVFNAGDNMGVGVGSAGNDIKINAFVEIEGVKYYAYSSHAYGFLEENIIPESSCIIKVQKLEGEFKNYRMTFGSHTVTVEGFLGIVEGLFAGDFRSETGELMEITKGEFRIESTLPENAELLD